MRARIYKPSKTAMQSGVARTRLWLLEFAPASAREVDPLARPIVGGTRLPAEADTAWIQGVADPADDLMKPLMGPFATERGGDEEIARAAIQTRFHVKARDGHQ